MLSLYLESQMYTQAKKGNKSNYEGYNEVIEVYDVAFCETLHNA